MRTPFVFAAFAWGLVLLAPLSADDASPLDLPLTEPQVLWKFTSEKEVRADGMERMVGLGGPALADGVLYFGNDNGRVYALRADDGRELWRHEHGQRVYWQPAVDKERVYIESDRGFTALRRKDGTELWRHDVKGGGASPLVQGNRVFAAGSDGIVYALDPASGKELWQHNFVDDAPPDPPGFDGKRARIGENPARPYGAACDGELLVIPVFDQCRLIAVRCKTGERAWSFEAQGWMSATPVIAGDRVYAASQDGNLYCVKLDTGELVWNFKTPGWFSSVPAVKDGKVFVPHHRGRLYQLDAATGKLLHTFEPADAALREGLGGGSVLLDGAIALFPIAKGALLAVDTKENKLRWSFRPSPDSEIHGRLLTDGQRMFFRTNQTTDRRGEEGIVAVGKR